MEVFFSFFFANLVKNCKIAKVIRILSLRLHCEKSVRIRRFSGPYLVRMQENTDQKNSKYGHFLHSVTRMMKINKLSKRVTVRQLFPLYEQK